MVVISEVISVDRVKHVARQKARAFLDFLYDKEKGEFLGKTPKGWGKELANEFTDMAI